MLFRAFLLFIFVTVLIVAEAPAVRAAECGPQNASSSQADCHGSVRVRLSGDATFFISPQGDDANSGTTPAAAWRTCGHAISSVKDVYDLAGHVLTFQFLDGLFEGESCVVDGAFVGQGNGTVDAPVIFQGNTGQNSIANPPRGVIIRNGQAPCFRAQSGAVIKIKFMWLQCVTDVSAIRGGQAYVTDVIDDNCYPSSNCPRLGTAHFEAQLHGYLQIDGNNYINATEGSRPADAIYMAKHQGNIRLHGVPGGRIYLLQGIAVAISTAYAEDNGDITVTGDLQKAGFDLNGYNVDGPCFRVEANSTLQWAGGSNVCSTMARPTLQFPGTSPGVLQQGGEIYADTLSDTTIRPVLTFGGGASGMVNAAARGRWQQTGSFICFSLQLALTAKGHSRGVAQIAGLPLPADPFVSPVVNTLSVGVIYKGSLKAIVSGKLIKLFSERDGALEPLTEAAFTDRSRLDVSGCYPIP